MKRFVASTVPHVFPKKQEAIQTGQIIQPNTPAYVPYAAEEEPAVAATLTGLKVSTLLILPRGKESTFQIKGQTGSGLY